ncbi:MAG TPA: amino acid--tRNA ligase-related protein, partial [candidate division Zixibacteria bacterium]|nr:amino acid--tRNA ligase-related protein [candidate division Zixibacteria bacterium]
MTENEHNASETVARTDGAPVEDTSKLIDIRREKAAALREQGINPYPYRFERSYSVTQALEEFDTLSGAETEISLAGRILLKRDMGKSIFADLHDQTGKLQIYFKVNVVGEEAFKVFEKIDIGDIIGVRGTLFTTRKGEKTLQVHSFEMLCKALHPLPDKHAGLQDVELRYRQRYVDLIVNPEVRDVFIKRTRIIEAVREFLNSKGFLEVETPVLQPIYGGAAARPFVTHHNALDTTLYLRIADELYLKRLIVGG